MSTIADTYRQTAADARRIARDKRATPDMRAAMLATAETNEALLASLTTRIAHEGGRLPRGTVRVKW